MREDELRSVLLVKAVEETDRPGALLAPADCAAAAREASRASGDAQAAGAARARILLAKIVARHPFVDTVWRLGGGSAAGAALLVALGLVAGVALSALDGTRRINILAFPVWGVVGWNLLVYAAMFAGWLRAPGWLVHLTSLRLGRLVARSGAFHAPLAEALGRFLREWLAAARPLLLARAARVLHLAAAAVGVGLILGLYARGVAFDYQAGWESTFLDAAQARTLLSVLYGPASAATGIGIPDAAALEVMRWQGERAARWIHLLAATVALFVVLPRLALALAGTFFIARWSRSAPLPASLAAYFRGALGGPPGVATIVPYAYEPDEAARAGLRAFLPRTLGASLELDPRAAVRYGEEEEFLRSLAAAGKADAVVLLFNLAATPEEENHGAVIAGVRNWLAGRRPQPELLVLVDEGPYAEKLGVDARVAERREAWQQFVAAHGLAASTVNLAAAGRGVQQP